MEDLIKDQRVTHWSHIWQTQPTQNTIQEPDRPQLITKKWLCFRFDLVNARGRPNYNGLYRHVLTPEVITAMGCTVDQVRCISVKTFTRQQSLLLIELLGL